MPEPAGPTVQMLWDIEQITQLKARYFGMLDTKDWDALGDLFTDDCQHVLPTADPRPPQSGTGAMVDYVDIDREDGGPLLLQGDGHSFETYRRCDDGVWRISSKRNVRRRVDSASRLDGP